MYYYPLESCFLIRDREEEDLDENGCVRTGSSRSTGRGNHNPKILCEKKNHFNKGKREYLKK